MKYLSGLLLTLGLIFVSSASAQEHADLPNIVVILADDLGYGDISCYNPESKVLTPNIDRLAAEGLLFTDAHSPSTVCTPTRYSLLTGRMAFRTGMRGVFTGVGGPCMIEGDRLTLPGMLTEAGYETACFGKWHVGMTFFDEAGEPINKNGLEAVKRVDYSRSIPDSPIHRGFDHFFGTVSCPTTDWLYAFVDGDRVPVPPTGILDRGPLPKHPYSRDNRPGMIAPDFDLEEVDLVFLEKSVAFIEKQVKTTPERPFFLYHAMQAVHLPSFAADTFKGRSEAGPHGDFLVELDHVVGELNRTLERLDVADDTLVIFTSDNGPEVLTTIHMRADHQHDGARPWRGMKRDQWEGGHRVPFIARWPGKIEAGGVSDQLLSLTDLMATCAAIVGRELPDDCAEDSYDLLPVLLGEQETDPIREYLLQQTISLALSIRSGRWKYLDHQGSGGNRYGKGTPLEEYTLPDTDPEAPGQLYDLETDPGETKNLYGEHHEVVTRLKGQLDHFVESGRSAPLRGSPRPNVVLVLVDDLGWSDLGCYGNPAVDTPRIDEFARQGMLFTDAYAAAPVCSPTRASIMTGLAPARLHITNHLPDQERFLPDDPELLPAHCLDRLPLEQVTLAEILQTAGYRTAFFGKWHLAPQQGEEMQDFYPDHQGFDLNIGGNGWGGPGRSFFAPYEFPNLVSKAEGEYLPYRIGDEVVDYLEQQRGAEEPFFIALWPYTVHWPMDSPADLLAKYQAKGVQPGIKDPRYAGMIEAFDRVFGRVLESLEEIGAADDTLVIFTSDNGALLSVADTRPLRRAKGYLYEGGIRVPMMVRWPGMVEPGTRSGEPVISTDLFATILDAARVPLPEGYPGDGVSLVPVLTQRADLERDALFFHYPNYAWHRSNRLGGAIRVGTHKLIERFDDGSVELYDLSTDLAEERDLAAALPDLAERLRSRLADWREDVDAAMPIESSR
jgi:arylsulfatase A